MKNKLNTVPQTTIILLILLTTILVFLFILSIGNQKSTSTVPQSETITTKSDLDTASDELDSTNIDAVDPGLNELNIEISGY